MSLVRLRIRELKITQWVSEFSVHTDPQELFGNLKLRRCCHLVASLMMGHRHRRKSRCRPSKIF